VAYLLEFQSSKMLCVVEAPPATAGQLITFKCAIDWKSARHDEVGLRGPNERPCHSFQVSAGARPVATKTPIFIKEGMIGEEKSTEWIDRWSRLTGFVTFLNFAEASGFVVTG
jgi:hypothetical protein